MSLQNATVKKTATISQTGGTDQTFCSTARAVKDGVHIVDVNASDALLAEHMYATSKEAVADKGGFGLARRTCRLVRPMKDAGGTVRYNSVEISLNVHPETTTANLLALLNDGLQMGIDTDFSNLWKIGSLI